MALSQGAQDVLRGTELPPVRRSPLLVALRLLLAVALLAAVVWFVYRRRADLAVLGDLSPGWLVALFAVSVVNQAVIGYAHREVMRAFDIDLSFREWLGLALVTAFGSLFLPLRGGLAFRALYLQRTRGFPYSSFGALALFLVPVALLVLGVLGLLVAVTLGGPPAALAGSLEAARRPPGGWAPLAAGFAVLGAIGAAGVWAPGPVLGWIARRRRPLPTPPDGRGDVGETAAPPVRRSGSTALPAGATPASGGDADWSAIWRRLASPRYLIPVAVCYAGVCLLFGARLYAAFRGLGMAVEPVDCLQAGLVLLAVTSANLTPANLGVREAGIGVVMSLLGYPTAAVLLGGLADRAAQLAVLVPLGLLAAAVLSRDMSRYKSSAP